MNVYVGYECTYNDTGEWRHVVKVFDDETKALVWKEECEPYEFCGGAYWREHQEFNVE